MYTLHHGFWIYFFTRHHPKRWQFVFGAMLPDYIYVVLVAWLLFKGYISFSELSGLGPSILMSLTPLFPWAVKLDLIGHSVVVWFVVLLVSFLPGMRGVQPLTLGWGTHLLIDAFTHGAFSNFYLFPLGEGTIEGPVSYWESDYWVHEYRLINTGLMTVAALYLVWQWWKNRKRMRK